MLKKIILSSKVLLIFLLFPLGLSSVSGCSTSSTTTTIGTSSDLPTDPSFEKQDDPIEPATLTTITLAHLSEAEGELYGEVRDRLLENGWLPHTFVTTNGPLSDFNDRQVQKMKGLGFLEVKACSGVGQGFCRFEFVHQDRTAENGPVLVVTTAAVSPGTPNYPEPIFQGFRLENVSNLNYVDRPFDSSLFAQLQTEDEFCRGVGRCEQGQYMFKDGLLIAGSGDFGTTKISFIPNIPVSKEEAIAYAKVLDVDDIIDFEQGQVDTEISAETYYEAGLPPGGVAELGSITLVHLQLTLNETISEISFSVIVL